MYIYVIPYQGKYIVYRPLRHLAFLANAALVNLIAELQDNPGGCELPKNQDAFHFLETIGFLEPDPPYPPPPSQEESFKPTVAVCLLTTQCNFRCIYCYASGGEGSIKELPLELGQRAIDTVCRNAVESGQECFAVSFHGGGEPTLARNSFKVISEKDFTY